MPRIEGSFVGSDTKKVMVRAVKLRCPNSMSVQILTFSDVLDSVDALSFDEKERLIDIIRRRLAEERRDELRRAIEESEAEYKAGLCKTGAVDEIKTETVS